MEWIVPRTQFDPAIARSLSAIDKIDEPPDGVEPIHQATGVQRLCAALIADAVTTIRRGRYTVSSKNDPDGQRDGLTEARAWVASNRDRPMTFVWCCHALRVDPDWLRRQVYAGGPMRFYRPQAQHGTYRTGPRIARRGA